MKFFLAVVIFASAVFVELGSSAPMDNPPANALPNDPKKAKQLKNPESLALQIDYLSTDAPPSDAKQANQLKNPNDVSPFPENIVEMEQSYFYIPSDGHHKHHKHHGHHKHRQHHDHQGNHVPEQPEQAEQPQQSEKPGKPGQIKNPEEIRNPGNIEKSGQIGTIPVKPDALGNPQ